MENKKKVYINPNFNRLQSSNVASLSLSMPNNKITMHVNPKFSQQVVSNKTKIYVNPNFLNSNSNKSYGLVSDFNAINNRVQCIKNTGVPSQVCHAQVKCEAVAASIIGLNKGVTQQAISQTRYSLVRNNANLTPIPASDKVTKTIKINKYKSVTMSNYKKKLEVPKIIQKVKQQNVDYNPLNIILTNSQVIYKQAIVNNKPVSPRQQKYIYKNKFVFRKPNSSLRISMDAKSLDRRPCLNDSKVNLLKQKIIKKSFKKNNIPCPLFKKYGKCLRSINGTCDFLHDKKHISICRKFLKGICQESTCLLSHDVTSKKMPTCYFYLKGMCTKDDCPYLHVKLNEKSKICSDFLKGYCEKGDLCLCRHVYFNSSSNKETKMAKKRATNSPKIMKIKSYSIYKLKKNDTVSKVNPLEKENDHKEQSLDANSIERRYYTEVDNEGASESNEIIKPSRCKLGTLPSYIKL